MKKGLVLNLQNKLIISFVIVGICTMIAFAIITFNMINSSSDEQHENVRKMLMKEISLNLESIRESRSAGIKHYFDSISKQVTTMADDLMIIDGAENITKAYWDYTIETGLNKEIVKERRKKLEKFYYEDFETKFMTENRVSAKDNIKAYLKSLTDLDVALQYDYISNNPAPLGGKEAMDAAPGSASYHKEHKRIHPHVRHFLEKFGYYDIFIVEPEKGHIVYSVFKELDFSTSLTTGPYSDTNFADAYKQALKLKKGEYAFLDFKQYFPSYMAPASFIASPIFNVTNKIVGVLIFQMPLDTITEVMSIREGMGEKAEAYMVGKDLKLRSNTHLAADKYNVVDSFKQNLQITNDAVSRANAGEKAVIESVNYSGDDVMVAFSPLKILDKDWIMLVEWSLDEVLEPLKILDKEQEEFWSSFINMMTVTCLIVVIVLFFFSYFLGKGTVKTIRENLSKQIEGKEALLRIREEFTNIATSTTQMVQVIQEMNSSSHRTATKGSETLKIAQEANSLLNDIVKSSEAINNVLDSIKGIANRTDLLALNASIEAASAGEAGKGFSVVANEVQNLASKTGDATNEITEAIGDIQSKLKNNQTYIHTVEENNQGIEEETANISSAIEEFSVTVNNINDSVNKLSDYVSEVTTTVQASIEEVERVVNG